MKSFSQFLEEGYFSEEDVVQGRLLNRKNQAYKDINNPNPGNRGYATDPVSSPKRLPAGAPEAPKTSPGQLSIPEPKTTKVSGANVRGAGEMRQTSLLTKSGAAQDFTKAGKGKVPFTSSEPVRATKRLPAAAPEAPKVSPGQQVIRQTSNPPTTKALPPGPTGGEIEKTSASKLATNPPIQRVNVRDITQTQKALPSATASARKAIQGTKNTTDLAKTATDTLGKGGKFSKWGGRALGVAGAGLDAADEYKRQREMGRSQGSSAAMGVTKAAGGLAGAEAGASGGAALGATIGSVVPGAGTAIGGAVGGIAGGIGGYLAGSGLAGKASDVVAGATGKQKAAMATANRQGQAGGAIKGVGGPTSFNTKNNTITSGGKTAQLGKTSVVTNPTTGKQDTGYLAYKNGQAVYKRPETKNLAQTSSNPLERIGRSLFAGAYKQSDAANAAKKLATARQSDTARNKALGVKFKPGG
jgi:hypothetical protein